MSLLLSLLACSPCESWEYLSESGECVALESPCESWEYLSVEGECVPFDDGICDPNRSGIECVPAPEYECETPGTVYRCTDAPGRFTWQEPCEWWIVVDGEDRTEYHDAEFTDHCWVL